MNFCLTLIGNYLSMFICFSIIITFLWFSYYFFHYNLSAWRRVKVRTDIAALSIDLHLMIFLKGYSLNLQYFLISNFFAWLQYGSRHSWIFWLHEKFSQIKIVFKLNGHNPPIKARQHEELKPKHKLNTTFSKEGILLEKKYLYADFQNRMMDAYRENRRVRTLYGATNNDPTSTQHQWKQC